MSGFGDISRMELSKLGEKEPGRSSVDRAADTEDIEEPVDTDMELAESAEAVETAAGSDTLGAADEPGNPDEAAEIIPAPETEEYISKDSPEVDVADTRERMAAPKGQHYFIDADISPKEMRSFLFAHNYRQPIMIFATLIGIIWPIYTVLQQRQNVMIALVIMALFVIVMPVNLWLKGGSNVAKNPVYQNTFHYMLDEAGVHLELLGKAVNVEWNRVYKTLFLKSSVVLYTGKVNAYLIPTKDMGTQKEEIVSFIKAHVK